MTDIKVVKFSKKYQNNIIDLTEEEKQIDNILNNTFKKYSSETNLNTYDYSLNTLQSEYVYVKNDVILANGKYIRYLDMKNPMEIILRIGGFVKTDNGYSVTIICPNKEIYKITFTKCIKPRTVSF